MGYRILIVEDDAVLAGGLCRALHNENTETVSSKTLGEARGLLKECQDKGTQFALILLDVNLPDGNGFDFLTEVKKKYGMFVIMLTANDIEADIVTGLEMGADDYITKPFSLAVLRARVDTQLRRMGQQCGQAAGQLQHEPGQIFVIDDYRFDFAQMQFVHHEQKVELSKTEQKLLRILVENRGITLTREQMLDYIWSVESVFVDENALSFTVKRLRDKLAMQERIKTVYGIGYRFE